MIPLRTERLLLRGWTDSDRPAFAGLNADLRVMEFMPSPLSRQESDELFEKIQSHIRTHGFGLYAAELLRDHSFIGETEPFTFPGIKACDQFSRYVRLRDDRCTYDILRPDPGFDRQIALLW